MIEPSTEAESKLVHQRLRAYNRPFWRERRDYHFHIREGGELIAGIVASSAHGTLEVEFLFVDEQYRRRGYGRQLLRYTEERAKSDGLRHILLNTYSFQAPGFYEKEGYRLLFQIEGAFGEHSQYFFWKDLTSD